MTDDRANVISTAKKVLKNSEMQISKCKMRGKSYNIHVKIKKLCEFILRGDNI